MKPIEQHLIDLVQSWERMNPAERKTDYGRGVRHDIELVGQTAAFFGNYDGMKALHDAAEALVGGDNSVGFYLNAMWDGIGGWCS